jgi:chemotaxis protein methyltransferase CheR
MRVGAEIIAAISERLADHAGLELPTWVVEARAAARMEALDLAPEKYLALIESGRGGELDELIEAVRVGETRLFRHRAQILALENDIAPALRAAGKRRIAVWSAGCAGGEEAYTLASVLSRALPGLQIQITATDVSGDALAVAQVASYRASAINDVPEPYRDDFVVEGERVHVKKELTSLVKFERANLVDSGATPKGCDLVWCRNVLIYFTPEARARAISRLVAATNTNGFLFVGYSESLRDINALEAARAGDAVYYIKRRPQTTPNPSASSSTQIPTQASSSTAIPRVQPPSDSGAWAFSAHTPPPTRIPVAPTEDTLVLRGEPLARQVTAELTARLGIVGLQKLVVDLDAAEILGDELAPVLRRARAAAQAAHVELVLRATRPGTRRWLARHGLEDA